MCMANYLGSDGLRSKIKRDTESPNPSTKKFQKGSKVVTKKTDPTTVYAPPPKLQEGKPRRVKGKTKKTKKRGASSLAIRRSANNTNSSGTGLNI